MRARVSAVVLVFGTLACRPQGGAAVDAGEDATAVAPVEAAIDAGDDAAPPLPPSPIFARLALPGHPDAVVSFPNGATAPRPVIVAVHGLGDIPEYNCDVWRHISGATAWVVCPRGAYDPSSPKNLDTFTLEGGNALRAHIDDALAALARRWPGYVDVERPILAGFSRGSWQIVPLATQDPGRFPRIVMIEGGASAWSPDRLAAFAKGGGVRAILACGQRGCVGEAKALARRFEKAGVGSRVYFADVGHAYDRPLQEEIKKDWTWFVDGDPRF